MLIVLAPYNKVDIMEQEVNSTIKRFSSSTNHCLPVVSGTQFCVVLSTQSALDLFEMKRVISRRPKLGVMPSDAELAVRKNT